MPRLPLLPAPAERSCAEPHRPDDAAVRRHSRAGADGRRRPPSELRRERRALLRLREQKLRDLGGLSLEMYRRDRSGRTCCSSAAPS